MRTALALCLISCIALSFGAELQRKGPQRVHAVSLGYPVQFSSSWTAEHMNYRLDANMVGGSQSGQNACSWSSGFNNKETFWIINAPRKVQWTGLTTKGRCVDTGNYKQYVTSYAVDWSNNGVDWNPVDGGKIFSANSDIDTAVTNMFTTPVKAFSLRVRPQSWNNHISMRFEVYHA